MKITKGQVFNVYKIVGSNYYATARQLIETHGDCLGNTESIKANVRRAFLKHPTKKDQLPPLE